MDKRMMRLAPLFVLLLIAGVMALGLFSNENKEVLKSNVVGTKVKPTAFTLPTLGNTASTFSPASWQNKIVVLNIFASWCESCIEEHAVLMNMAKSGKVEIIGIAWKDEPQKVLNWLNARGNPYQVVGLDAKGSSSFSLALTGVPETFVFDRDGTIAYHYKAAITEDMANNTIIPLVERLRANAVAR